MSEHIMPKSPLSHDEITVLTPHWTTDNRTRYLEVRDYAYAIITAPTFHQDTKPGSIIPNQLCPACEQILSVCRELIAKAKIEDHLASQYIVLDYTYDKLHISAGLGCHLCSIFDASLLKYIKNHRPSIVEFDDELLEDTWLYFTTLPFRSGDERFPVLLNSINGFILNSTGNHVDLFPSGVPFEVSDIRVNPRVVGLSSNTGSEATFEIIAEWLRTCLETHPQCKPFQTAEPNVPKRLLHLGETTVQVIVNTQKHPYACLSHCWGSQANVPHMLKDGNYNQVIPIDVLPKTFRDAIYATRRLGVSYLWIDCFCIVQGSQEDWLEHAAVMAQIYANSLFTIAALGKDTHVGCFQDRNPLALQPLVTDDFVVETHSKSFLWRLEIQGDRPESSPLHTRAWVVQERLSAPRTIFFGSLGVYWECRCMQGCESRTWPVEDVTDNTKTMLAKLQAAAEQRADEPYQESVSIFLLRWQRLLEIYTACDLTFFSDKLIALAGITKDIEKYSGRQYIQGLWMGDLPSGLLWVHFYDNQGITRKDLTYRVPDSGFPSWSWASMFGRIDYFKYFGTVTWSPRISIEDGTADTRLRITTWKRSVSVDEDNLLVLQDDGSRRGDLSEEYPWYNDERVTEQGPLAIILIQRVSISVKPCIMAARCLVVTAAADNAYRRVGMTIIRFSQPRDNPYPDGEPVLGENDIILV